LGKPIVGFLEAPWVIIEVPDGVTFSFSCSFLPRKAKPKLRYCMKFVGHEERKKQAF